MREEEERRKTNVKEKGGEGERKRNRTRTWQREDGVREKMGEANLQDTILTNIHALIHTCLYSLHFIHCMSMIVCMASCVSSL